MMVECIDDRNAFEYKYTYLDKGKIYQIEYEKASCYGIRTPLGITHYPKSKFKMAEVHYVPTQEGDKEDDI